MNDTMQRLVNDLNSATYYNDGSAMMAAVFDLAPAEGEVLEFGVGSGSTIKVIAELTDRTVHGFDSFLGLPEHWDDDNPKGKFSTGGKPPEDLPANVMLWTGWFEDTVPKYLIANPGRIAFVHVDCDLYSSTKTVLDKLGHLFLPGCVLNFNEFWDYPKAEENEALAFSEFVERTGGDWQCVGKVGYHYSSVAFQLKG